MVILNLLAFIAFCILAGLMLGNPCVKEGNSYRCFDVSDYRSFESSDKVVKGILCLVCAAFFLLVTFSGCCAVCCRVCCCGAWYSALSVIFGIVLFAIGVSLATQLPRMKGYACNGEIGDIVKDYYDQFIDQPMCSEACPCINENYEQGLWDDLTAEELANFGRAPRFDDESELIPLMTDVDSPEWDSLSPETQAQLTEAGYSPEDEPPAISNYRECFDTIISTEAFKNSVPEDYQQMFEDFRDLGGFDFLASVEEKYECAGICYEPLFYITQDVSLGRPNKECLQTVMDEALPQISIYAIAAGAILLLTALFSFTVCCGIPAEGQKDFSPVIMKPAYHY